MFSLKNFTPDHFVQEVLRACKFTNLPEQERLELEKGIHKRLAERIVATIMTNFGDKEAQMYNKLFEENPNIDEIEAIIRVSSDMPGVEEKVDKAISGLFEELTYDADQIEKTMQMRKSA